MADQKIVPDLVCIIDMVCLGRFATSAQANAANSLRAPNEDVFFNFPLKDTVLQQVGGTLTLLGELIGVLDVGAVATHGYRDLILGGPGYCGNQVYHWTGRAYAYVCNAPGDMDAKLRRTCTAAPSRIRWCSAGRTPDHNRIHLVMNLTEGDTAFTKDEARYWFWRDSRARKSDSGFKGARASVCSKLSLPFLTTSLNSLFNSASL
ncbi:hypothetical protein [Massilia sp. Root335]|uniref:hypothetical protein n=1 Tax=Massilia sp. Root335 TaxID=1736517 RepID=UPI0006F26E5D|nr:hypothetical protein [Massilia sp. Root335]KQV37883.1 hypothetical protein ASC93_02120 [Massilia sp. Root335]